MIVKTETSSSRRNGTRMLGFALFVLFGSMLHAQVQYNQWTFGWNASYSFTPSPGPLPTAPAITSLQDAASWCDNSGNLMFYTDGKSIFNTSIPGCTNCLNGNPNSGGGTQGVLILPQIGASPNDFYIFTVSDKGALPPDVNYGLSYYRYNAALGTLSPVVSMGTTPGTTGSYTTEGLTAMPHANGTDWWIIVKAIATTTSWISSPLPPNQPAGATNSSIYAYRVTSSGVDPNPVISDANYSIIVSGTNAGANAVNEIKCSPDGRYMCMTNRTSGTTGSTNLFRFNSTTGEFTFLQTLPMLAGYAPMGSSFSPNSRVLYVCGSYASVPGTPGDEVLRQYDLTSVNCDPFTAVPFCDFNTPVPFSSFNTQLQLTPDGRIFRTRYGSQFVDVISTPNNIGCASIGYSAATIQVGNIAGNSCRHAFPNNIDAQPGPPPIDEWPKTTTNTVNVDNAVATDVDENGDVYSTGTFNQSTQFESTVVTGGTGPKNTYLVKYDACKGMEWVARATSATWVACHSMDVGENVDRVFVTGRYIGGATFYSGVGGPLPCPGLPVTVTGNGIFIAVYNYNGCLLGVNTIPDDATYTHMSAHVNVGRALNPLTGIIEDRVYVAVNETTITDNRMRIFSYSITGPGTLSNIWITPLRSAPNAQINDIASYGTTFAVTGVYDRDIFWNTSMTSFATTPTGVPEAFVATARDENGFAAPTLLAMQTRGFDPGTGGSSSSSGSGVHLSGSSVFLTGTYTGTNTSAFGTGVVMPGNGTKTCGYAIRLDATGTGWAHTFSADGPVVGIDITGRTGSGAGVYFTGIWESDSVFNIDNTAMPAVVPMKKHMYVVKILLNGTFTGTSCWQNHSYTNNDASEYMKSARIAVFSNKVYVNGSYMGTGQMFADGAFNSPLTSTAGTFNSFVWRYSELNGTSFREAGEQTENESAIEEESQMKLYPNPASLTLNIQIPERGESTLIEIYSASGQLMLQKNVQGTTEQVDVSQWTSGIYFIRMTYGEEVITEKFVRE